jgi:hypothetical protein
MNAQICAPHLERLGLKVPAAVEIAGTPMCRDCYKGQPLRLWEVAGDLRGRCFDAMRVAKYRECQRARERKFKRDINPEEIATASR